MLRIAALFAAFSAVAFAQTPTIAAVVNGASYGTTLCPGLLATVYGTNFGTNVSNVLINVGGNKAYVIGAFTSQIEVQLPFEAPTGPTTLTVTVGGVASTPFNITLSVVSPYFLTQNAAGTGLASVVEASGTTVTTAAPAKPGDTLSGFAVGLGATSPTTPTGVATATNLLSPLPAVTVGGVAAKVVFAGLTKGGVPGVYQVNFTVPTGVQGTVPLIISIDGAGSSNTVTLAVAGLSSVVNSGSFAAPGTASPGSIATVFANALGTTTNQLSGLYPASASEGVQVTFNGVAAPLFNVVAANAQQQIDVLVPTNLPTTGTVNVQLTTSSGQYPVYQLTMVPANPGFFRLQDPKLLTRFNVIAQFNATAWLALPVSTTANLGYPACTSTTPVTTLCGQPATAGDYLILYMTGLGLATPNGSPTGTPLATGSVAPADGSVLYETPTTPVVTVGGVPATVAFSGIVPSTAGEYEIVIQVPSGVPNGDDTPIKVTMLGASDTATISIQPRAGS